MNGSRRVLSLQLSSTWFDSTLARVVGFATALVVLVLGTLKLTKLSVNETELFFGVLLVGGVALNMICLGILASRETRRTAGLERSE